MLIAISSVILIISMLALFMIIIGGVENPWIIIFVFVIFILAIVFHILVGFGVI